MGAEGGSFGTRGKEGAWAHEKEVEEGGATNEQVHKAFGRDTALGRSLFNLYNKGRVEYTPRVRVRTRKDAPGPHAEHEGKKLDRARRVRERREAAAAVIPKRRVRAAPKPRPFFDRGEGRRPAHKIEAKTRADFPSAAELRRRPVPKQYFQPREEKIALLQERFENPGKARALRPVRAAAPPPPAPAPLTAAEERQQLFSVIEAEIAEREDFISEMRALGALTTEMKDGLKAEIADRVRELRGLDAALCDES